MPGISGGSGQPQPTYGEPPGSFQTNAYAPPPQTSRPFNPNFQTSDPGHAAYHAWRVQDPYATNPWRELSQSQQQGWETSPSFASSLGGQSPAAPQPMQQQTPYGYGTFQNGAGGLGSGGGLLMRLSQLLTRGY